jgi:hypothetical protein
MKYTPKYQPKYAGKYQSKNVPVIVPKKEMRIPALDKSGK